MLNLKCQKTFSGLGDITRNHVVDPLITVTDILIIGGILTRQKEINGELAFPNAPEDELSSVDMIGLFEIVQAAMENGIGFDKPNIRLSNFIYGDDQVDRPESGQLTIYSWVNFDGNFLSKNDSKGLQSPSLKLGKTWEESINQGNPQLVAVEGDRASTVSGEHVDENIFLKFTNDGKRLFDFPNHQRQLYMNRRL